MVKEPEWSDPTDPVSWRGKNAYYLWAEARCIHVIHYRRELWNYWGEWEARPVRPGATTAWTEELCPPQAGRAGLPGL